jgi:hypothetical protein
MRNPAQKIVIQRTTAYWWLSCPFCNYLTHFSTVIEACNEMVAHSKRFHPRIWAQYIDETTMERQLELELGATEVKSVGPNYK